MPSLTAANTHDRPAVVAALGRVLEQIGRPRRIGLVVPDVVAKVSLVRFEQRAAAGRRISISWSAGRCERPRRFRSKRRRSATCPASVAEDGQRVHRVAARGATIIEEYEELCAEAGAHAGLVDLATFNVINAVLAGNAAPAGRLAAGERRRRLRVDRDSARIRT